MMDSKTYNQLCYCAIRYLVASRLENLRLQPHDWLSGWPKPFSAGDSL
ncbi:MAG: hypothetical protein U0931_37900 [Vulcanimicrobiota bacterium]